jgi:hypothetical protein
MCLSIQTIVNSKWLMINGTMEKIQEGEGWHHCYRVYRHDMPFTEGMNVWVKFNLDKKCKLISDSLLVEPAFLQQWVRIRTSLLRY